MILMKKAVIILGVAISILLTTFACKKKSTPISTPAELLASNSQKSWQIEKLYINDTLYALTNEQKSYSKTYSRDSSFIDSDGIGGRYVLNSAGNIIKETVLSGGTGTLTYTVETLNNNTLILRLISDGTSSLNNQFHFRAK